MWRSVVVARAAVSSRQGGAVWRRFYATQNPKHKVPASSSSKAQTQTESEFPVFSTNWGFPKRLFICQNPRFYSQTSTNTTDSEESSVGFVENGDTQLENSEIHGVSEQGFVGIDENRDTQLDSFIPRNWAEILGVSDQSGDAQFDSFATGEENGDEEEEVYEINVEQLENVLSLLQSSVDGSLESALDDMGLTLHEEFVVKVLETPLYIIILNYFFKNTWWLDLRVVSLSNLQLSFDILRMWRSVVVARAAVSSRQGEAVWRRFYATQNPKHKVPASSSSKAQTQTESEFPVFSTNWGFPKRLFICQNPRFYSQTSTNTTDSEESSVGFVENGDTQLENSEIHGVSEQGLVGIDENRDTQLDSFIPRNWAEILGVSDQSGDAQFDSFATGEENGDEEEEVYEINVEQLENVLSLLQSSVDGSLESALDDMGLTLHEEFVVKVLETPLVLVGFVENGDTQLENSEIHGVSEQGLVGIDENRDTQLDSFIPRNWAEILGVSDQSGDAQFDSFATGEENGDEEEEVYEINVEQLENVLSLLQSSVDGSLESALDDMGLTLHEEFVVKVLETPLVLGENLIRFFKWGLKKKSEFKVTTCVVDALVRAISRELKKKDAYALWDLIKEIGEKENGVLNVEILNQLIALLSKLGKGKASLEVFNKFGDFGCVPNVDTYYFTIEALCRRSMFGWAWSVCEKMLDEGSVPENEKEGKIISWLCKGRKAKDAHSVYLFAKEKNQITPQSSVNFLISSLCREDETVKLALEMLDDFSGEARKYAIKPFSTVIHGLCRMKDVDGAKQLLSKMIAEGPPPGNAVFNSVISGYSKAGDLGEAIQIKKLMESRGLKPDVYTYTVIMSGYTNGGQMEEACKLLSEAKKKHSKLTPVTYHTLIRGYCKLEEFDKALKLLAEMKDFDVQPNVDEYNKLIQSLCLKALDWETAEKLLEEMKGKGLHLNGITKGLIRAVKEMEEEELVLGS
ncbi:pentatricopeptide repeat-containing protein [Quercus suber]|uniref:Pentatricopeptide repeat-containing protein n=1 Tax=Quercus suber TaxID=58331 RepID=A0AAW0JNJ9_QUESU